MAREIVGVGIESILHHINRADSLLDEPTGNQATPAKGGITIPGPDGQRFLFDGKGSELAGRHHFQSRIDRMLMERGIDALATALAKRI